MVSALGDYLEFCCHCFIGMTTADAVGAAGNGVCVVGEIDVGITYSAFPKAAIEPVDVADLHSLGDHSVATEQHYRLDLPGTVLDVDSSV